MLSHLVRRVVSLFAVLTVVALGIAPGVAAADPAQISVSMIGGTTYATEGVPFAVTLGYIDTYDIPQPATFAIHIDWGDGTSQDMAATGMDLVDLSHTYAASGQGLPYSIYTATATVTDSQSNSGSGSLQIGVQDVAPVVTAIPATVPQGFQGSVQVASFTDASVGPWYVDVDGGVGGIHQTLTVQVPGAIEIPYSASNGSQTLTVSVGDSGAMFSSVTTTVTVVVPNVPPTVSATVSATHPQEPQAVVASATFTDPESATETYTCTIDYGDGSASVAGVVSGMTCTGPQHRYVATGLYVASVSVTDSGGGVGVGTATVSYQNMPPQLSGVQVIYGIPYSGGPVRYQTSILDQGAGPESYDCSVDFGDGTAPQPGEYRTSGGVNGEPRCVSPDHYYPGLGTYDVTITVRDSGGAVATAAAAIYIYRGMVVSPPTDKTVHSTTGHWHVDETASFVDDAPAASPWYWYVDWGDGTVDSATVSSQGGFSFAHDYTTPGSYHVQINVRNALNDLVSTGFNLTLIQDGPVVSAPPGITVVTEGVQGTFYWAIVDPAPHYPYSVHVDWGDGSTLDLTGQAQQYYALPHIYKASDPIPGTGGTLYVATMTVVDAVGAGGSGSQQVGVQNVAPVITAPATISVPEGQTVNLTLATFTDASVGPWNVMIQTSDHRMIIETLPTPSAIVVPWDSSWGSVTVTVYVTDRGGLMSTATIGVSTLNSPPVVGPISLVGGDQPIVGHLIGATATYTDPGSSSSTNPETYTCTVNFGDGSGPQSGPASQGGCGATHTYSAAGAFTISITVSDSNGGSGSSTRTVTVQSGAPRVGPIVVPSPLVEGQAFVATAAVGTTSPQWCGVDFGNGIMALGKITGSTCSAPNFAYPDAGTYTITFSIKDTWGATGSSQATVTVGNVPPVVSSILTSGTQVAGGVVTVFANFSDPGTSETFTCTVDFGDGTGPQPGVVGDADCTADHTYSQGGLYTVTMTATDSNGGSGSTTASVPIANLSPTVGPISISGSPTEGANGQASASFTDPWNTSYFHYCTVDYGDGTTYFWISLNQTCLAPIHDYANPGAYTVLMTVDRGYGDPGTSSTTVSIANVAPVVTPDHIVAPAPAGESQLTSVDFTDPGLGIETYTCTIDYGDGGGAMAGVISNSLCTGPDHAYASKGTYTLVATVTDSNGGTGTYSATILVYNPWPIVGSVSAPVSTIVGTAVTASAGYTATGQVPADTCAVDYGDGTGPLAATADGTTCTGPTHKYTVMGTYTITVSVTAANAYSVSSSATIRVFTLQVGAIATSGSLVEGSAVTASAGFTPTGRQTYTCKVDYGDGSGAQTGTISGTTCKGPSHKWGRPGSFTIAVSVTGSKGNTGSSTKMVAVANVAPTLTVSLTNAKLGSPVKASVSFTDPGTAESYFVQWLWGDGTSSSLTLGAGVRSTSSTHTYAKAGLYNVTIEVNDGSSDVWYTAPAIAVYDPTRTLAGSGTMASPAGACQVTPKCGVASTATFSVSAKYSPGATKPTFALSFAASGFSFVATSADWFVVQDGMASVQGGAKVNGATGYSYLFQAVDGHPDLMNLTVFNAAGSVVYDTFGLQSLKTGSITIK